MYGQINHVLIFYFANSSETNKNKISALQRRESSLEFMFIIYFYSANYDSPKITYHERMQRRALEGQALKRYTTKSVTGELAKVPLLFRVQKERASCWAEKLV